MMNTFPLPVVGIVSADGSKICVDIVCIWELWKKVLENIQTQNDTDSLENLNVIQLGNKIGSESTRKYYPEHLIDKTEMIYHRNP
ncbi:hypothetical protein INT47_010055 [Mucor saturninus]|uniref:Uncharacterized protein n=1 Tax=Mucor saturninus TaxID=64648 RepID=A0A8H7R2P6_9FUNG|nr:hypothetical protein INT47_010055 [Mucor saturninus]